MLLTKLHIPSSGENLVHRSILFDKLNEGFKRKLILISAPAGFGKSTVISDWINQQKIPTAWFSVDGNDNDPVDFLSYVISAIQGIEKGFGQTAFELLKSPNPPNSESIVNLLINEILNINNDFLLVLDDFHLITNNEIIKLVCYLLENIPGNAHIAVLTRSDPAIPIARLRSQHQLVELRSSDLSFSANDISILFNKRLKIKLSVKDIHLLETKTEGWIAGLQLTALSLLGRENVSDYIETLKGDNRYIMDYLIEEVLKIQSDDIKEFLLQTSILEQISAPLCNAVLSRNDSQLILEELEKNNMFVFPLDEERHWYRYHHLFADLLKQRLLLKDKSAIVGLHNKACEWFEQNNMHELAIDHALKIDNYEKSIQILGEIVENMWETGLHAAIMKYGDILPDELIKKNPDFCLYYAWILISAGDVRKAELFLGSAEIITEKRINDKNSSKESVQYNKNLFGKIAIAFAYLNSQEENSDKIIAYCKTGMENLSKDDSLWYSWAWYSIGVAHYSRGNLNESTEAFNTGLEYGKKSGNIYQISTIAIRMAENDQQLGHYISAYKRCTELLAFIKEKGYLQITKAEWAYAALYLNMGATQFIWADVDRAFENIKIAYNLSRSGKDIFLKTYISMVYSAVLKEIGDVEAENKIRELEGLLKRNSIPPFLNSMYVGWKSYIHLKKNQIGQAYNVLSDYGIDINQKKTYANESVYSSYVRLLLAQNKLDEAELLIQELYTLASAGKRIERIIDLKVASAILYKLRGERKKAVSFLIEAMEIASDENLLSFFVFSREHIDDLIKDVYVIQATSTTKIPNRFIDNLKQGIEKIEKLKKTNVAADLSTRELDTLKLIAEDLTNQQVADKLFISLNTVKTHLKNIYLKFGVDSRAKAIAKAKESGLM